MADNKIYRLFAFTNETLDYFLSRLEGVTRDLYFADRDKRNILDKSINDIILCLIDIAEECLKKQNGAYQKLTRIPSLPVTSLSEI